MDTTSTAADKPAVKPIPDGMHSLTPHLICANASEAIDFYKRAFGAEELSRLTMPDGKLMHAMLRIGNSALMLMDENPAWGAMGPAALKNSPVGIHLMPPSPAPWPRARPRKCRPATCSGATALAR